MELNDSNIKKSRWLIVFTVVVVVIGVNYRRVFEVFMMLFGFISPFLLGGVMAFILNVPMRRIEKMLPMKENSRLRRPIGLVFTLLFVVGLPLLVIFVVMPQLFETFMSLQNSIPVFLAGVKKGAEDLFAQNPEILDYINGIQIDWKSFSEDVIGFLSSGASTVLNSTITAAVSIVSGVTTFGIALVFAIYILFAEGDALGSDEEADAGVSAGPCHGTCSVSCRSGLQYVFPFPDRTVPRGGDSGNHVLPHAVRAAGRLMHC